MSFISMTVNSKPSRRLSVAVLAAVFASALPAAAGEWLSNAEIETALKGQTLEGVYATGRRFTERYHADGRVEYTENGVSMEGHWSATADTLCTIYDSDPSGGCFRVAPSGQNCLEFYFVTRDEATAPGPPGKKPDWTARGMVGGEVEACPEISNV